MLTGTIINSLTILAGSAVGLVLRAVTRRSSKEVSADGLGGRLQTIIMQGMALGAMAIVGALENGLTGSYDTLKAKSIIDGISSIVFASSLGVGVAFSAGAIFLYQGAISLLAGLLSPLLGDAVIAEMTCVGSLLIVALSLNMLNVTKIKVMNLVPAIFLPILLCRFM